MKCFIFPLAYRETISAPLNHETIIYSSPHRQALHEAKIKILLRDDPSKPAPLICG